MTQALYCSIADVKNELSTQDSYDDPLLATYVGRASSWLERVTGRTYARQTLTDWVATGGRASWDRTGIVRMRLPIARPVSVTAIAVRTGSPTAAWTPGRPEAVDWDEGSLAGAPFIRWYSALPRPPTPWWVRVSALAGWVGDADDPYPPDLVELVVWYSVYLYRGKDAPFEATANPAVGTVTIPSALPPKLRLGLERWSAGKW